MLDLAFFAVAQFDLDPLAVRVSVRLFVIRFIRSLVSAL